jgi:hypothetical protein
MVGEFGCFWVMTDESKIVFGVFGDLAGWILRRNGPKANDFLIPRL